jgi:transposase
MPARRKYDLDDWYRTAAWFVVTGSIKRAAKRAGVPFQTVYQWRKSLEWEQIVAEVRQKLVARMDADLQRIVKLASSSLIDRLVHGEEISDRKGGVVKKHVSARDLATILGISIDKRAALGTLAKKPEDRGKNLKDLKKDLEKATKEQESAVDFGINAETPPPLEKFN